MTYTKVNIPKNLVERIRKFIEDNDYGYRSIQEFVIESVRIRLQQLEQLEQEKERRER